MKVIVSETRQPWLKNQTSDLVFILLPPIIPIILILTFYNYFKNHTEVTSIWWIILILNIDVAHVYSTLFRFFWEKDTMGKYKKLLILIPCTCFIIGVILYSFGSMIFWRTAAYLAIFHFIRQQYGFMRLYSRKETKSKVERVFDAIVIYSATVYPLLYWHFNLSSDLHWFVEGDVVSISTNATNIFSFLYWLVFLTYIVKVAIRFIREDEFNVPKNLLILGTYLSWYLGIITFKGDLTFTLLNVVAHGVPYMGLVFFRSQKNAKGNSFLWKNIILFCITILLLAYLEEGLWDGLIWRDHENIFPFFSSLPFISSQVLLSILVPLLTLPQLTHYILDGFIWRISKHE